MIQDKENALKTSLSSLSGNELYIKILEMSRSVPSMDPSLKTDGYRVKGCQSISYLAVSVSTNRVTISLDSDALISKGLISLLYLLYNGETIEDILKHPIDFLKQLPLGSSFSLSRLNGLSSAYVLMKQQLMRLHQDGSSAVL